MQEKRAAQDLGEPFFFILEAGNLLIGILLDINGERLKRNIWDQIVDTAGVKENRRPRCGDNKDG